MASRRLINEVPLPGRAKIISQSNQTLCARKKVPKGNAERLYEIFKLSRSLYIFTIVIFLLVFLIVNLYLVIAIFLINFCLYPYCYYLFLLIFLS